MLLCVVIGKMTSVALHHLKLVSSKTCSLTWNLVMMTAEETTAKLAAILKPNVSRAPEDTHA